MISSKLLMGRSSVMKAIKLCLSLLRTLVVLMLATFLIFLTGFTVNAEERKKDVGRAGTTLTATVTAEGKRIKKEIYDWSITKTVDNEHPVLKPNIPLDLTYTLTATRKLESEIVETGIKAVVTVTNGGERATEGLKIVAFLENVPGASVTIVPNEQLQPGQTKTYPVQIMLDKVDLSSYKIHASVTITNHSGSLGTPKGPTPKQGGVTIPVNATVEKVDETATINDVAVCPEGFTCNPIQQGAWSLKENGILTYVITVTGFNPSAIPDAELINTAKLVEGTTKEERTVSKTVTFTDGGTTLNTVVTGEGFRDKKMYYDWSITKSVHNDSPVIKPNGTVTLRYLIEAIRSLISENEETYVRGEVFITNGGNFPTEGLIIHVQVEGIPDSPAIITPSEQLPPGHSQTYPIEIRLSGTNSSSFKLVAQSTITNHSGSFGIPKGSSSEFNVNVKETLEKIDETAIITDVHECPGGFTCNTSKPEQWLVQESSTINYATSVTNISVTPGKFNNLINTAILEEETTKEQRTSTVTVVIFSGCCP